MGTLRFSDRRFLNAAVAVSLLIGMALPSFIPSFASALSEVTNRSVKMTTSAASATSVSYTVTFTPVANAAGYVIDFCDNTPLAQQTCNAPAGFSTASVTTATGGTTVAALTSNDGVQVTKSLTGSSASTVVLDGITNPSYVTSASANNGFYARIVTYSSGSDITAATDNTTLGGSATDEGGVALATTNSFTVNAAVLESMTFCLSGTDTSVSGDQTCGGTLTSPNLTLGVLNGGAYALSPTALSTGTVYTQLSTNANDGAVVNLKSSATNCGGLVNIESPSGCYISPAPSGGFSAGTADFGVKLGTAAATASDSSATGTLEAAGGSSYNTSNYFMHFVAGNATGVTSPYGDPLLDTNSAPVNNMNMPLTFGASISNNTPSGEYQSTLNLVATGQF